MGKEGGGEGGVKRLFVCEKVCDGPDDFSRRERDEALVERADPLELHRNRSDE